MAPTIASKSYLRKLKPLDEKYIKNPRMVKP